MDIVNRIFISIFSTYYDFDIWRMTCGWLTDMHVHECTPMLMEYQ